jgi:hypothetical protein
MNIGTEEDQGSCRLPFFVAENDKGLGRSVLLSVKLISGRHGAAGFYPLALGLPV